MQLNTFFLLIAEYNSSTVELSKISEKYFAMTPQEAAKRANLNLLPVPAFKCGSQKSNWMIHVQDLADHIDRQRQKASSEWQKMNG